MSQPRQFGYVACLSGGYRTLGGNEDSVWSMAYKPGEDVTGTKDDCTWLAKHLMDSGEERPRLYMCCGREDFLYQDNLRFHEYLNGIGFEHVYHEQPGVHNWDFWDDEIRRIRAWLPVRRR